ncbi:hypothetical protein ACIQ6Y_36015 [Streptomyces sp. NPDC096205]|uniref:hypothetical protein n=1 Tax=Streptomyces sp. NPDC096205 TaxID=3366081 RepID=UPI003804BEFC
MFEYEIQQLRSAELIRRADHERLAREAVRQGRAARTEAERRAAGAGPAGVRLDEAESHSRRPRRLRSPRTA